MHKLLVVIVAVSGLAVSGCGSDLSSVPMPSLVSGPTYTVDAVFTSALNLPEQAPVKLDSRTVGEVTAVTVKDYEAHVRLKISRDVHLPDDVAAAVRTTAPLGDAYVALTAPAKSTGRPVLADGAVIGVNRTTRAPDTTDLLTGLSMAVTGGSYADLKTIVTELKNALSGHTDDARDLLRQLDILVTGMNEHRGEIDSALDSLDEMTAAFARDSDSLAASSRQLAPALDVLSKQQDRAMRLLTSMTRLSDASVKVINASQSTLVTQLHDASKILDTVLAEQARIEPMLTGVSAFASKLEGATPGDYAMFELTVDTALKVTGLPLVNLPSDDSKLPGLQVPTFGDPTLPPVDLPKLQDGLTSSLGGPK